MQFGRANQGAPGGYVYALEPWETEIRLVRVPVGKVQSSADYEYFSGSAFAPAWKLGRSGSKAIFVDLAGTRHPTITYIPALDRYLLTVAHSTVENSAAHKMGIFEAPNPWGPWRTVSYVDNFLGMTGGTFFYMNFPLKWQADNGATLWATFSCYSRHSSEPCGVYHDRFNLIKATLDVVPEPPPPTAVADDATTNANTPVLVPVLGNDTGTQLTVRTVSTPTNGTARINTDRTVTYTPKTGYTGSDAFTYLISDGFEQPATATVTITVLNRPPVAAPDNATTVAPASVRISVLANDTDPDGHSLTIASATTAAHGTTTISSDRKAITYKPAAGYSGSDSFTYTISDNHGGTGQGVVTVAANNRSPIASADNFAVIAGKSVKLSVLANDSDPDGHRLSVERVTAAAHGSATVTTDRRALSYKSAVGYVGADSFTYTAGDGYGGTAQAVVSLSVQNRPPVAVADSVSTAYNTSIRVAVLANDSDPDGHGLTIAAVTAAAHGTATISTDRKAVVYRPTSGYRGGDSFTYTASDGYGGNDQAAVAVTVRAPNSGVGHTRRRRVDLGGPQQRAMWADGRALDCRALPALVAGGAEGLAVDEVAGVRAELLTGQGVRELWLTTTNDNLDALRFYQRRELRLVEVRAGAIDRYRQRKPTIIGIGKYGIALRDELRLVRDIDWLKKL